MNLIVKKTLTLHGEATLPSSKSQTIRAIILASLSQGTSTLNNILCSEDTQDAINACKALGVKITQSDHTLTIESTGLPINTLNNEIHSGNSGITTHFVMPILGLRKNVTQPIILNCREQMRARPIRPLVDALSHLGLTLHYLEHASALPIRVSGELCGGKATISGVTSQYLSALLFALPCASGDSEITVKHLQERPYAEMTLHWLRQQGIQFHHQSNAEIDTFIIKGKQTYKKFCTTITGDFSSASYLLAAAAVIPGEVILKGLNMADLQGDKRLVTLLQTMGADIVIHPTHLHIRGGRPLSGIKIEANDIPDLVPTLAVIGTYAAGKTEIYSVAHVKIKETNRIHSMVTGLTRLGAKIREKHDSLIIYHSALTGAEVKGYGDHRTVMALSVAGMLARGTTTINDGEAINKTFPAFVCTMQALGAKIVVENANAP